MAGPPVEEPRLARLTGICLALPEAVRALSGRQAGFRVRGRPFAYWLDDHHGDGIVAVAVRLPPGQSPAFAEGDPARWYLPAYIGRRGWVGRRLDSEPVDWDDVAGLVADSYRLAAPRRLAGLV